MKLLNVNKIRDVPNNFLKKVGLFVLLMLIQQVIAIIGSSSAYTPFLGIFLIILAFYIGKKTIEFCLSYQPNNEPIPTDWKKSVLKHYVLLFVTMFGYNILYKTFIYNPTSESTNQSTITSMLSTPLSSIFVIGFTLLIAPFIEEFCFRYLLLNKYLNDDKKSKQMIMIILSSLCFGLLHMINQPLSTPFLAWVQYLGQYMILGLFFANNYVKSKNYKQSVALHITWNTSAFLFTLLI